MDDVQTYRHELGKRIAAVVAKYSTKTAASEAADVSVEQLNKWMAGAVKVPVDALYRLAMGIGADFCWLCGDKNRGSSVVPFPAQGARIQPDVLRDVLGAIAVVAADGVTFQPDKYADLVFALHDYVVQARAKGQTTDLSAMTNVIRLASR